MKLISFFSLLILAFGTYSQDSTIVRPCNQLPIAGADKKAVFDGKIEKYFAENLNSDLKKGTHKAVFKLMVDCYGIVSNPTFQSGTLKESNQKLFLELFLKSTWKPAIHQSANVTTFVFVTIDIVNGKVSAVIQ